MTRKEMQALVEAVTREVLAALAKESSGPASGSACACKGGCGCSNDSSSGVISTPSGEDSSDRVRFDGRLLTEDTLRRLPLNGQAEIVLGPGVIVTPLARDRAAFVGVNLVSSTGQPGRRHCPPRQTEPFLEQVAYFTARPVLTVERILRSEIEAVGASIAVCPVTGKVEEELEGALSCAARVSEGSIQRAVVLAEDVYLVQRHANRLPGVRARVCSDARSALESRRCDDSNVLLLSGRLLGQTMIRRIVQAWLSE